MKYQQMIRLITTLIISSLILNFLLVVRVNAATSTTCSASIGVNPPAGDSNTNFIVSVAVSSCQTRASDLKVKIHNNAESNPSFANTYQDIGDNNGSYSTPSFVLSSGTWSITVVNILSNNPIQEETISVPPPVSLTVTLASDNPPGSQPGGGSGSQTGSNPTLDKIFGVVNHPSQLDYLFKGLNADQGITALLSKVVELIYIFAAVVFVFYILYSGIEFIYSEGHKESIAEARGRIIWAIIGIVILAIAFVFLKVLGYITNFKFFGP